MVGGFDNSARREGRPPLQRRRSDASTFPDERIAECACAGDLNFDGVAREQLQ